jgi:CHAT domain-containing protein
MAKTLMLTTDAALEVVERGRARAFVELLAKQLSPQSQEGIKYPSLEEIKQIAQQQNATLVEYSILPDQSLYIWVIQPTGKIDFRSVDLKTWLQEQNTSLADLVSNTRESIGVSRSIFSVKRPIDENNQTKRLQQLHQLLIKPIADLLPTDSNQRVIFIPQNELFLVPFAAIQDQQGKYLIEKHTILTAPAIQVLQLTREQRQRVGARHALPLQQDNALIVGNPTMPSLPSQNGEKPQKLANLPGAKREAEAIAPLLNTKALTGNEATETVVKAKLPQAHIIHLATHGLFDDNQGLQSAIALAPTNTDNGLLTAEEILKLKLNAQLIVLSACDTGRGRITGDGVIGLSRSLIAAGTPSVIVSLWAVPDNPTEELMTEFYRQLKLTGDKAQALRTAMLKLKEKYPDSPRKWAAFTLIGEAQ